MTLGIEPQPFYFVDARPHQLTYLHNLPKVYKIGLIAYQEFLIFSLCHTS